MLEIESDDPQDKERRWEDFWDALDFVRLQLEAPLQTSFSAVFEKLLPVRERLALPGATTRARITGGDATLGRIVAVDWSAKVFHASTVGRFQEALRAVAYQGDETEIISVMETAGVRGVGLSSWTQLEWRSSVVRDGQLEC